jgi:hypothetical protein
MGIPCPSCIRSHTVKWGALQQDRLSAVITEKRAAVCAHRREGTNGRLAGAACRPGDAIGIVPMELELFCLREIGLVDGPSFGVSGRIVGLPVRCLGRRLLDGSGDLVQTCIHEWSTELRANAIDFLQVSFLSDNGLPRVVLLEQPQSSKQIF